MNCIKCDCIIIVDDTYKHYYDKKTDKRYSMCKDCLKNEKKTRDTLWFICELGDLELVKYFTSCGAKISDHTMVLACRHGHLDIVKHLYSLNANVSKQSLYESVHSVELLKFFKSCGIEFSSTLIEYAIGNYHTDTLKYFYDIGIKFTENKIYIAFAYFYINSYELKHVNTIVFLHSKGLLKKIKNNVDDHIINVLEICNIPFRITSQVGRKYYIDI